MSKFEAPVWAVRNRNVTPYVRTRSSSAVAAPCGAAAPRARVEHDLTQPHGVQRHLDALVVPAELQCLLQGEAAWRDEPLELLGGRGPHVRELLLLRDVDVHVLGPGVLADDHAPV